MWNRKDVRKKGREAFKKNYWKSVFVAFLFALIAGGMSGVAGASNAFSQVTTQKSYSVNADDYESEYDEPEDVISEDVDMNFRYDLEEDLVNEDGTPKATVIATMIVVFLVVFIISLALGMALAAFLMNPMEVGINRFFFRNLEESSDVAEIAYGYDHSYLNVVKVLFIRDIKEFLWSLLLIIPGIIKSYEYRMVPYLLSEKPDMDIKEAFATSRQMMNGQKWRTFVFDLSFLGWHILGLFTLGILEIFYVMPYQLSACAALYETLRYGSDDVNMIEEKPAYEL